MIRCRLDGSGCLRLSARCGNPALHPGLGRVENGWDLLRFAEVCGVSAILVAPSRSGYSTISSPRMSRQWPGKVHRNGYRPGVLGAVKVNSARPLGFTSGVAWSTLGDTGK